MASRDKIYNEIHYSKKLWDQGHAAGDQKGMDFAHQRAQQYYNMLDPHERKAIQGMNTQQLADYRQQMRQAHQQRQEQREQPRPTYEPPVSQIDFDQYRTQSATIDDLQEKYGFDYSREYAARQAEAEAQARRDAIAHQQRGIDSGLEGAVDALDRDYFQRALQQMQGQVDSGISGGIAADQDLRMAMSRQAAMGDMYRDANLEHMRLRDDLGRVDVERLAREDALFNERLNEGFANALALTESDRASNQQMIDALLNQRSQDIDQYQFGEDYRLREGALTGNYLSNEARSLLDEHIRHKEQTEADWYLMSPAEREIARAQGDAQRRELALLGYNVSDSLDAAGVQQQMASGILGQTLDSQRLAQEDRHFQMLDQRERDFFNSLSASDKRQYEIAEARLEEEKRQFNTDAEWRRYKFNNMSATDKAQLQQRIEEVGMEQAWREAEQALKREMFEAQAAIDAGYAGGGSLSSQDFLIP